MKSICYSAREANTNQAMKDEVQTITDTTRSSGVVLKEKLNTKSFNITGREITSVFSANIKRKINITEKDI